MLTLDRHNDCRANCQEQRNLSLPTKWRTVRALRSAYRTMPASSRTEMEPRLAQFRKPVVGGWHCSSYSDYAIRLVKRKSNVTAVAQVKRVAE